MDLAIGETSAIESTDKGKIQDIVQKVKDLNGRLTDIRREQVFQRVSYTPSNERCLEVQAREHDVVLYDLLTFVARNVRPNSEINPSLQTQELSDGP